MRIRRLSGLEEHLRRRRSSVMRSREGTSSKLVLAIVVSDSDVVVSRRTERESLSPTLCFFGPSHAHARFQN